MFLIIKYQVRRKKIKFLHKKEGNHSYWKKFHVKSNKKQNIFLHISIKISENLDITHLDQNKADLSKEIKKASKKRYSTSFRSSRLKVFCKKVKKFSHLFICILLEQTSGSGHLSKSVKILISEKIALSSIFYFKQVLFSVDQSIKMCWNGFYT